MPAKKERIKKPCAFCKKDMFLHECLVKKQNYCSLECRNNGYKGVLHTEEHKKKISLGGIGRVFSKETRAKLSAQKLGEKNPMYGKIGVLSSTWKGGLPDCIVCRKKLSVRSYKYCRNCFTKDENWLAAIRNAIKGKFVGKNNFNWKGGITPVNEKIRKSIEYFEWRKKVFLRDNYICQWCRKKGGDINADHIKMFSRHSELRFDINNGRTLCKDCHAWKTRMDFKIFRGKVPELNYA